MAASGAGRRVAVALSGGVDSTVAALLLKRQGYNVVGVHMRCWDEKDETGACNGEQSWRRVQSVSQRLQIECVRVDFVKEYWNQVFTKMLEYYRSGLYPCPDLWCNSEIKFGVMMDYCRSRLGADKMATGHYAGLRPTENGTMQLTVAKDSSKDQTYFLAAVTAKQLQHAMFPLANVLKRDVFKMAREVGFGDVAEQPESRGLCFIGKRDFPDFISEYIEPKPGPVALLDGTVVAEHNGNFLRTIGQRAKFTWRDEVRHRKKNLAYYVCRYEKSTNTVYIAPGGSHPTLLVENFTTFQPHWISGETPHSLSQGTPTTDFDLAPCNIIEHRRSELTLLANGSGIRGTFLGGGMKSPTPKPGQPTAIFDGDVCLGYAEFKEIIYPEELQFVPPKTKIAL